MRKVIVSMFVSLDGVMEGPGPADVIEHSGWTMPYVVEFKHFGRQRLE